MNPSNVSMGYRVSCIKLQKILRDNIVEGDWLWRDGDDKVHVMSSRVVAVQGDTYRYFAMPVMKNNAAHVMSEDEFPSAIDCHITQIDFDMIPIQYWHKVYRLDQLMSLLKVDSYYTLLFLIDEIEKSHVGQTHHDSLEEMLIQYYMSTLPVGVVDEFEISYIEDRARHLQYKST